VADTLKPNGGWLGVRNDSSYHNDTITDRITPWIVAAVSNKPSRLAGRFLTENWFVFGRCVDAETGCTAPCGERMM
jgi:hypothetical protein